MKKFLAAASAIALLVPTFALASAYNDVTLTSASVLVVGGITLNVSGATLNKIQVDSSSFTVTLGPSSTITVSAPNLNQLSLSTAPTGFTDSVTCTGSTSNATMTAAASAATSTVTVTPSNTLCATSSTGGGGGGSSGGGGNGAPIGLDSGSGSGPVAVALPNNGATTTTTSSSPTTATIAGLQTELQSLLAQIAVRGGNASVSSGSFTRNLTVGSTGSDVTALQVWLNGHGYTIASSGAGSPGDETSRFGALTKAALAKFQAAVGISPAVGYFGTKTRAYIAAHP